MRTGARMVLLLAGAGVLSGCFDFGSAPCERNADCPAGERCDLTTARCGDFQRPTPQASVSAQPTPTQPATPDPTPTPASTPDAMPTPDGTPAMTTPPSPEPSATAQATPGATPPPTPGATNPPTPEPTPTRSPINLCEAEAATEPNDADQDAVPLVNGGEVTSAYIGCIQDARDEDIYAFTAPSLGYVVFSVETLSEAGLSPQMSLESDIGLAYEATFGDPAEAWIVLERNAGIFIRVSDAGGPEAQDAAYRIRADFTAIEDSGEPDDSMQDAELLMLGIFMRGRHLIAPIGGSDTAADWFVHDGVPGGTLLEIDLDEVPGDVTPILRVHTDAGRRAEQIGTRRGQPLFLDWTSTGQVRFWVEVTTGEEDLPHASGLGRTPAASAMQSYRLRVRAAQ